METWVRILILVLVAAIGGFCAVWPRIRVRLAERRLHLRLAAANGLSERETRFLWQIARVTCPERPAMVFVRPSLLDAGPAATSPDLARAVHDKLFRS